MGFRSTILAKVSKPHRASPLACSQSRLAVAGCMCGCLDACHILGRVAFSITFLTLEHCLQCSETDIQSEAPRLGFLQVFPYVPADEVALNLVFFWASKTQLQTTS